MSTQSSSGSDTGSDENEYLDRAVDYFKEMKDFLNKYKDCVVVNIANEWTGNWSNENPGYTDAYKSAVKSLRDAGIDNVLMVDAAEELRQIIVGNSTLLNPKVNLGNRIEEYYWTEMA